MDKHKDLVGFHGTRSAEVIAKGQQVRLLLGASHWASDGGYKEQLIMQAIRSATPNSVTVGTGFMVRPVKGGAELEPSKQCDVIIFDSSERAPIFQDNDFSIILAATAIATVEVKSTLRTQIGDALDNILHSAEMHKKLNLSPSLTTSIVGFSDFGVDNPGHTELSQSEAETIASKVVGNRSGRLSVLG